MYKIYNVSYTSHFVKGVPRIDTNRKKGISRTELNEVIKKALQEEPDMLMLQVEKEEKK